MKKMWIAGAAIALASFVLPITTAGAAPKADPAFSITLFCPGRDPLPVSTRGNGDWTPAHDLGSNSVFVPIAFGEFTGTFTPTGGDPMSFTDPPFAKRNTPRSRNPIIECTYTANGSFPEGTFTGGGTVTLMVPGSPR